MSNALITLSGTVGMTPVLILSGIFANILSLRVINPTNSHYMAVTYDNGVTAPVIGSVGIQLTPYGVDQNAYRVPYWQSLLLGVYLVADANGVPYNIEYEGHT